MSQEVYGILVTSNESTDRSKRLRECTHDKVNLVSKSEVVTNTSSVITKNTERVSLVNHDRTIVLLLQLYYLWQLSQIAFHREYSINDNQLYSFIRKLLQEGLKVLHIIVLILKLFCEAQTASVNDTGMISVITDNVVLTTTNCCNNTCIYRESSREAECFIFMNEFC